MSDKSIEQEIQARACLKADRRRAGWALVRTNPHHGELIAGDGILLVQLG